MLTLADIGQLNPWWTDTEWVPQDDPHLSAASAAPFTWDPRPFDASDIASGAVFTLRGPRQCGKTTLTKRLIADRVAAGLARRTCYLTLRVVEDADELRSAIAQILRLWPADDLDAPWLFVLDELTFVKDWADAIAHLREFDRDFRRATIILTGSSGADLTSSSDDLHGRRGRYQRPLDRLHMPMSFRDYVGLRDQGIRLGPPIGLADLLADDGRQAVADLALHGGAIDQYLGEYARCGGLPAPVTDMLTDATVHAGTIMELWRGLSADVRRLDRSEERLAKLVSRTVVALTHLTNLADVARDMDVTKTTAGEYIRLLAQSFGIIVLHQRDRKRQGGPSLTLPRKHYFGDPAFAAIPAAQGGPAADISGLVENVLAVSLFRHVERNALESFAVPQRLFLWRSARGREIDFIVDVGPTVIPVECKYTADPSGKDYESMAKAFGRGVMASRVALTTDREVLTVPVGALLVALG